MFVASYVVGMKCTSDGRKYPHGDQRLCEYCFAPLKVVFDYTAIRKVLTREKIRERQLNMWRYLELLPVSQPPPKSENVGFTELYRADRLAEQWGVEQGKLYIKFDGSNWTGTLKPRVTLVGVQRALELGYRKIGCVSTGNLSSAVAAAGARLGLETYIFAPANTEPDKLKEAAIYGARVVALDMDFSRINQWCNDLQESFGRSAKFAILNLQLRPDYSTGAKTLAFETAEQLGWRIPRNVVVPIAAGNTLVMIANGFHEFRVLGLADGEEPRVFGAQSAMCNPVSAAVKARKKEPLEVKVEDTIAKSLVVPRPGDGKEAIRAITRSGGFADDASDDEVRSAIAELAQLEGIYAGTAGGVTLAVAKKMIGQGRINADELTVVYVTDGGLRTPDAVPAESELIPPIIKISDARIGRYGELEKLLLA